VGYTHNKVIGREVLVQQDRQQSLPWGPKTNQRREQEGAADQNISPGCERTGIRQLQANTDPGQAEQVEITRNRHPVRSGCQHLQQ
jgi:hypothetical protein